MTRLASRFGAANSIRRDRPLTVEELFRTVPSVFSEENTTLAVTVIPIFPPLPYWIACKKRAFIRSLRVKPVFEMKAVVIILSICFASDGMIKLRAAKSLKSSYLIAMMAQAVIRCCRVYSELYAKMV